jgi:hypothetical protein
MAATLGDTVYVLGGRGSAQNTQERSAFAVDARSGRVTSAGRLPFALSDSGSVSLGGRILLFGGRDRAGHVHDDIVEVRPR